MRNSTFLKSLFLLCALIVGAGTGWAAETPKVTWDFTDVAWEVKDGKLTNDVFTITGYGKDNFKLSGTGTGRYFIFGKKDAYITLPVFDFAVSKIIVIGTSGASTGVKMNAFVGDDAVSTETIGLKDVTQTYEIPSAYQAAGNAYTLKVTSSHNAQISKIQIIEAGTPSVPVDPIVTFENDNIEIEVGETSTNELTKPNDLSVTFSSNKESVATVDSEGQVTGKAIGTATITASWDAVTGTYNAGSKSYTVTVLAATEGVIYEKVTSTSQLVAGNKYLLVTEDGNVMGEQNGTVRKSISLTINENKVKVKKEAVAVLTLGGTTDAWTFTASDNDKLIGINSDGNRLDASETNSTWKITNDFQVNNVGISGRYIQYNYNSGDERFAAYKNTMTKAYLYVQSGSATDTKADPELSYATTSYAVSFDEAGTFVAPSLTNPNRLKVTYESSDDNLAVVDANTGEVVLADDTEGTVTITASFAGDETYKAGSASYTITIYDPNVKGSIGNPYTVAEVIDGTASGNAYVKGFITGYFTSATNPVQTTGITSNTNFALSDTEGNTDPETTIAVQLQSGDLRDAWNLKNNDRIGFEVLVKGSIEEYFKPKMGVKSPTEIIAVSAPATVSVADYATWVAPFNVEVPSGVSAYYVSNADTKATLSEVLTIPAGEPVVLKNAGDYRFNVIDAGALEAPTFGNLLKCDGKIASGDYVLAKHSGSVGFYKWTGSADLPANQVYLPASSTSSAPDFISLDGETTGISAVEKNAETTTGEIYNLNGQRVSQPTKGLYIVNGKKVVVK